ncbi:MAG TPA: hypothetical protein VFZ63_09545 [Jiangellaceae bacterium]
MLVPVAIGIAIVRYELFDIRLVLSRTILYALTLSAVVAVYAVIVTTVSLLVPADDERGVQILAAIVVAIGFNPLRLLLQRAIDRRPTAHDQTRSEPDAGSVSDSSRTTTWPGCSTARARRCACRGYHCDGTPMAWSWQRLVTPAPGILA